MADLAGLYRDDKKDMVIPLTVEELKTKLDDGDNNDFCLHTYQRMAVYQALTQPLSLIQVYHTCMQSYMYVTVDVQTI